MTGPNRPGSEDAKRGEARAGSAAVRPRLDGRPKGGAGWSPGRRPPARSPGTRGPKPTGGPGPTSLMCRVTAPPGVGSAAPRPAVRSVSAENDLPRPTHTRGLSSPPPPLPSTVTIPVPVPKAASAHGPKRIEIWERSTDGRAREGLRLRSGDDRWRRRLRCWGGGRRGALSLRRAVSRRRRHRRRLSRRRR